MEMLLWSRPVGQRQGAIASGSRVRRRPSRLRCSVPSRLSGPPIPRDTGWRFKPKLVLFGLVVVGLIGIVAFAAGRETAATSAPTSTRRALPTPRPALTSAEQAYLQALWPIHADVERSTMRITLAQIFYKIDDLDRPQLKTRIDEALASYRRAEARLRELQPPSSLRGAHDDYLVAVGLFDDAAVE